MTALAFVLGMAIGIVLHLLRWHQFNRQLRKILNLIARDVDEIVSLPITSLIRRKFTFFVQQQQHLEAELQAWEALIENAPVGYLRVDEENQLLQCNQQARQLLKLDRWQPGQVRLLLELVRSYELDQLIEQTRHTQQQQLQEWIFHAPDYRTQQGSRGHVLALKASSYPLAEGQVGVFLENRQPLVDLSQSRDRLFTDLAHELRTPLTSIGLVVEALQKRLHNPERHWIEQMQKEIGRLIELVQNWLAISQQDEDPTQKLNCQTVELHELILSSWQILEPIAQQKAVSLIYLGPDSLCLQADKSRLTQVFLNLFDNSIKHNPSGQAISISVQVVPQGELSSSTLQIDIVDSGAGFLESDLPYIFDRRYRGEASRSSLELGYFSAEPTKRRGSGLGLAIVQQIIQAHEGTILARNHPETKGAWLQVKLPLK